MITIRIIVTTILLLEDKYNIPIDWLICLTEYPTNPEKLLNCDCGIRRAYMTGLAVTELKNGRCEKWMHAFCKSAEYGKAFSDVLLVKFQKSSLKIQLEVDRV